MDTTFDVEMPQYVLPGYELVRQVFAHIPQSELPVGTRTEDRTSLKSHPAVAAKRSETVALLDDLAREDYFWRIYHVYVEGNSEGHEVGVIYQVTVVCEVYKVPEEAA